VIEIVNRETGQIMDADSVPGLAEIAAVHDRQLAELRDLVAGNAEETANARGPGSRPFVWADLTPVDAAATWTALARWVGWLRSRYPLARQVPRCWWRHPELVEELTALWLAWQEAYVAKGAPLTAAADWHGRWLPELLRRMRAGGWNIACEGEHKPTVESLYDRHQVDEPSEFHAATGARSTQPTQGEEMEHASMQRALEVGTARLLGDLPGAPIAFDDRYWQRGEAGWIPVEDQDTIAFLTDAEERLRLAEQAANEAGRR
jgi:hypothetical protein